LYQGYLASNTLLYDLPPFHSLNHQFPPNREPRECAEYIDIHLFTRFAHRLNFRAVPAALLCDPTMKVNLLRFPQPNTVYRRIIENERLTQKTRMLALAAIQRPTRTLLFRLLSNPDTPARLLALAAERYETEILKRELRKNARQSQNTPTDN
jgi:hypothetical protein